VQHCGRSKMKRILNRTDDVNIRKMSKVSSVDDGNCQRSKKISTAAAGDKVDNIIMKMANKNTKMQKQDKVEKTAITHQYGLRNAKPTKYETVNNCTDECTDSLRTGKLVRKVSDVQCKRRKTECKGPSLSSSFGVTMKRSGKKTDSVAGKQACSLTSCSEVNTDDVKIRKISKVTSVGVGTIAAKKTGKAHKDVSSCTMSLHCRTSRLPAADVVRKQGNDAVNVTEVKNDVVQTVQETVIEHKIPPPCSSVGMTLRSSRRRNGFTAGNTTCEQSTGVVHCNKENDVAETVKEMNSPPCSTSQQRRNDGMRKGPKDSKCSSHYFHMTLRPRQQCSVMAGKKSQTVSIPVSSMKHHSLKSEDKGNTSQKPCRNGSQIPELNRCYNITIILALNSQIPVTKM